MRKHTQREITLIQRKEKRKGAGLAPPAQKNLSSTATAQLKEEVVQMTRCKYCSYENGHAPGCTPQSRQKAKEADEAQKKVQHDQSMDNRTREDQSHPQHGGDAQGRQRKYDRWNKKDEDK